MREEEEETALFSYVFLPVARRIWKIGGNSSVLDLENEMRTDFQHLVV